MTADQPRDTPSAIAGELRDELAHAREEVSRITVEYDEALTDGDVIQEDRDSIAALLDVARRRVRDLEHALGRLEEGTYGRCSKCGVEIPAERLEALPDADMCVSCG